MKRLIILFAIVMLLHSCTATRYYKVTFKNGETEYYSLPYKVKKGAKVIEYEGQTILGIDTIEEM